jgi:hypothetical protein
MKLPHSPEDELGVLGSCLLDCALIPKIDLAAQRLLRPTPREAMERVDNSSTTRARLWMR